MGNNETTPLRPDSSQRIHEGQGESDKREFCSTCSFLKRHGPPVLGNYVLGQVKKKIIVSRPDFLKKRKRKALVIYYLMYFAIFFEDVRHVFELR